METGGFYRKNVTIWGKERGGGVTVPSVLCHCSVRCETDARGMERALCSLEQANREATENDVAWISSLD